MQTRVKILMLKESGKKKEVFLNPTDTIKRFVSVGAHGLLLLSYIMKLERFN